jgi:type IV pilus assembly protein PilW
MHNALTKHSRRMPSLPVRASGFTLIEMMISITIGLGILAGLVGVLASTSSNSKTNDRSAELMTNGRYALNSIKHELRQAGFRGYTWAESLVPGPYSAPTNGCVGAEAGASVGAFISNLRQGVWGADNSNPFGGVGNCIPDADYAGGNDVVVIRRLADTALAAAPAANTVYFASTYDKGQVFRGSVAPPWSTTAPLPVPLANFAVQEYVYFVRPWTVAATESPAIPALCRVWLQTDGTMATELVASGIERMQVQYGRLTTAPDMQYLDTLLGSSSDTNRTAWDDVNSVRIWMLARSVAAEPGYVNTTVYPMGNSDFTAPGDSFRRQVFAAVVQLRN